MSRSDRICRRNQEKAGVSFRRTGSERRLKGVKTTPTPKKIGLLSKVAEVAPNMGKMMMKMFTPQRRRV